MLWPERVTITGADDTTSVNEIIELSAEFPFVEWGILVSQKQEGRNRFPSRRWIDTFITALESRSIQVSTHMCGIWVRQLFLGSLHWADVPACINVSQRIQINTHAEDHLCTDAMVDCMKALNGYMQMRVGRRRQSPEREFIFQWDGKNGQKAHIAAANGIRTSILFDTSGGAGILPDSWPKPLSNAYRCGYAGGIGPENVTEQVHRIATVTEGRSYWIDMERRVRSDDDSYLDMAKVRSVLEQVSSMRGVAAEA